MFTCKIKYYRNLKNLTLKDLAKLTGLSIGYLAHLEIGSRKNPSITAMCTIANVLDASVEEIFFSE